MSNGAKRKPKPPQKTPVDRAYDEVCRSYGSTFDVKLKKEEYKPLLDSMIGGNVSVDLIAYILRYEGLPVSAKLSEVFPLSEVPRKSYVISGMVGGYNFPQRTVVILPATAVTCYIISLEEREVYTVPRQVDCFLVMHGENDLPYDMKKWHPSLPALYFRCTYANNRVTRTKDPVRTKEVLNLSIKEPSNLVQIRKINPNLSKKQAIKVENEKAVHSKKQSAMAKAMAGGAVGDEGGFMSYHANELLQQLMDSVDVGSPTPAPMFAAYPDYDTDNPPPAPMIMGAAVHVVEDETDEDYESHPDQDDDVLDDD